MSAITKPSFYEPVFNEPPSSLSLFFFNYLGRRCFIISNSSKPNQVTELPYKLGKSGIALRVALLFTVVVPAIALICTAINWYTNRKGNYQIILQTTPAKKPLETRKPDYTFPANHPHFPNARYCGQLSAGESWQQGVPAGQPFGQGTIHLSEESPIESICGDFSALADGGYRALAGAKVIYRNGDRYEGYFSTTSDEAFVGVMYYKNGDIAKGTFRKGKPWVDGVAPQSKSTFLLKNGLKIDAVELKDGQFSSLVEYEYYYCRSTLAITTPLSLEEVTQQILEKFKEESHYDGETDAEGRYHDQGILTVNEQIIFDGIWKHGEMAYGELHGETSTGKFKYFGRLKNNKMHSNDEDVTPRYEDSAGRYLGGFKDNLMQTTAGRPATYYFKDNASGKDKYEGHFKDGLMDTTGRTPATCHYVNGDRYYGDFVKGKRDTGGKNATYYYTLEPSNHPLEPGKETDIKCPFKDDRWTVDMRKKYPEHTFY